MGIISNIHAYFAEKDLNPDGQPVVSAFRAGAVADRQISELIGMIRMVMSDGELEQHEAAFLLQWLEANRECSKAWPASVLYPRLTSALADGVIDSEEESELLQLLAQSIGRPEAPAEPAASFSTRLPLTSPLPEIMFKERSFCFTGKLMSGTRAWALLQVEQCGGFPATSITKHLHYLVIGELGSRDWVQSTHGRKIEKAIAYVEEGTGLAIISEEHWFTSLGLQ